MAHPLDEREFVLKMQLVRTLTVGMIVVLTVVSVGFAMVVFYALEGVPLLGNRFTYEGVSIPALVIASITPFVPLLAWWHGRRKRAIALSKLQSTHPEMVSPNHDAGTLLNAFFAGQYGESAVLFGVSLTWAILFHLISSPIVLGSIGFLILFLILRMPFTWRVKGWFDREWPKFAGRHSSASN
ncbi:MAG: hypothetical protein ACRC8S_18145 [Fimbriiglobus sp.]